MTERQKLCAKEAADEIERLVKRLAEAEAALRNTLLHYEISDVHFLDSDEERKNLLPQKNNLFS